MKALYILIIILLYSLLCAVWALLSAGELSRVYELILYYGFTLLR